MALSVDLESGRRGFVDSVQSFVRAVDGFDEHALLGASRCHGWTRLDVVVHVIGGWQEMLAGLVSAVDAEPTVDGINWTTGLHPTTGPAPPTTSDHPPMMSPE